MSCDTFPSYSIKSGKVIDTLFRIYTTFFKGFLFNTPNKIHLYGNSLLKHAKKIGIRKSKIAVISTGINTKKFDVKTTNVRNELKIPKNKFVITFCGLTTPRKGVDIILKIAKQMQDKIFLIVGDGPSLDKYKKDAKELKNVIFTENRRDLPEIFKASNAFFLPSRGEGLPGVVMEAMAAGLPVVTTITGCVPDLIKNDYNGYLCPIDDIESMKQALIKVSRAAKYLGNNGKKKIKKVDWQNLIEKYKKLYS